MIIYKLRIEFDNTYADKISGKGIVGLH